MLSDRIISLDGDWKLCYVENKRFVTEERDISSIEAIENTGWSNIPAVVPGNFELDFERAGIIGDPFYATNAIENHKYENLHLIYYRRFTLDFIPDANTRLVFDGIDTIADIYINGKLAGQTDNMLIAHELCDLPLKYGENELIVHIRPTVIEARKYEVPVSCHAQVNSYELLFIRKAPHMGGWDIMPRIISGGIWRPCRIVQRRPDRIDDLCVYVQNINIKDGWAGLTFFYNLTVAEDEIRDYSLIIDGSCGDSKFHAETKRLLHTAGKLGAHVGGAKFWWPRNYGDPNLYDIRATLCYLGKPVYEYSLKYGIRSIRLERTSTTDVSGNGEFCFYINDKKIFWLGSNWVPVDALHSRDRSRLPEILPMLCDIGCNSIRCWGGNVYEDDYLYDFCDANGIMIWQDFSHACAINPQTDEYCARFSVEVESVIKRLRNHASLIVWAGDNEVDACYRWSGGIPSRDPNQNRLTREVIPKMLWNHDTTRPYIPSSPYIDEEAFKSHEPTSEEHLWGPRDYFKGNFYRNSVCHFASETGYHGCPSPETMKRIIRPEQLWHWYDENAGLPKPDWTAHAACFATDGSDGCIYRIKLMSDQVKTLFVDFRDDEAAMGLENYARASQISQAEAKKYFIERFRISKWRRTGIIWWNLIDGWGQISDAVVDYYGVKKLAYHYIKRSQQPFCLMFDEPDADGRIALYAVSDLCSDVKVKYTVADLTSGEKYESVCTGISDKSIPVWYKPIEPGEKHFYLIDWSYEYEGVTITGRNHYMTNIIDLDFNEYISYMKECGFYDEFEGF